MWWARAATLRGRMKKNKVALFGPMGSGKSTIGQTLSALNGLPFLDLDEVVSSHFGTDIVTIFGHHGEPTFRHIENLRAIELLDGPGEFVLAAGGGTIQHVDVQRRLASPGVLSVYLRVSAEAVRQRLDRAEQERRPLLADGFGRWTELLQHRQPLYEQCSLCIDTDGRSVEEIARVIDDHR
jgi:shikimate kinase